MLNTVLCSIQSLLGKLSRFKEDMTSYYFSYDDIKENNNTCEDKNQKKFYIKTLYSPEYDKWLRSYGVVTSLEAYKDSREPFIYHGYRHNPSPVWYCIKSALYPTNETFSFWTHFIPLIIVLHRAYNFVLTLDDPTDSFYYPFYVYVFGSSYVLAASSFAHLFNPNSPRMQEFCFCVDYAGIAVYGISNLITNQFFVCPNSCFVSFGSGLTTTQYFVVCGLIASLIAPATCCSRLPKCPQRYLVRFLPTIFCYCIAAFPCHARLYFPFDPTNEETCYLAQEEFPYLFIIHTIFYLLAAIVVLSRWPEKYFPGKFDIFGHSHQLFHICIAIGMYIQQILLEHSIQHAVKLKNKGVSMTATKEGSMQTIILVGHLFICSNVIVYKFSKFLGKMVEHRRKLHQN